jgi:hypothetical protein
MYGYGNAIIFENKLKKIEEVISLKLEDRNIGLCNDIEYFFHINNNQQLTINDFMKFFEGFRSGIRIDDQEAQNAFSKQKQQTKLYLDLRDHHQHLDFH